MNDPRPARSARPRTSPPPSNTLKPEKSPASAAEKRVALPRSKLAGTWPALVDKYVLRKSSQRGVFACAWVLVFGTFVWQDNAQGTLTTWEPLRWTLIKGASIATCLLLGAVLILQLARWLTGLGRWLWTPRHRRL
jgi:hypothetical protein